MNPDEKKVIYIAPVLAVGIGMWKESMTIQGQEFTVKRYFFPFLLITTFERVEATQHE